MENYDTVLHIRLALDLLAEVIQGDVFTTPEDKLEACLFLAQAARDKALTLENEAQ